MALPPHAQEVVDGFRQACSRESRPGLCEYLKEIGATATPDLLAALIDVDFEYRCAEGDVPRPEEYDELGAAAVGHAQVLLLEVDGEATHHRSAVSRSLAQTMVDSGTFTTGPGSQPPSQIGPYSLEREIGKGGMGSVWMAKQTEPVRRTVAIKLIRGDIDSEGAMARFKAERAAIALMDHPNIARILDAGQTADGTPYFVMEMVEGVRFDKYCDQHKLGVRERLKLMVPVCRAVQHAHQKGIVHRDLKHSNILVTESDGKALPKVIDFGLAKVLEHRHVNKDSMLTGLGEIVGTLRYMSPEQAHGEPVDTRTDIYSLGVVLYRLLAGSTPIDQETVNNQSFVKILETIRATDPPRPSARLDALDETLLAAVCKARSEKPEKLKQALRGDLDWIVMKALEKEPSHRYETANGIARELERYLNDEEVAARPPSGLYRIRKFMKRNRAFVTTLSVFLVMLIVGVIGTTAAMVWALDERDRANTNATAAREQTLAAVRAEREAVEANKQRQKTLTKAKAQLHAIRMKSALSEWQMGNAEPAWDMLKSVSGEPGWETSYLQAEFTASEKVLYGHASPLIALDISPDGRFLVTVSEDHTARLWDARGKKLLARWLLPGPATDICFSADGSTIACSDLSNHVSVWKTEGDNEPVVLGPFDRDITAVVFIGDGKLVIGDAHEDSYKAGLAWKQRNQGVPVIRIFDLTLGEEVTRLTGHSKTVTDLDCTDDGKTIVSCSLDGSVRIWRLGQEKWVPQVLESHRLEVLGVAIAPSQKTLASCGRDKTVRLWNLETGALTRTIVGHSDSVTDVAFSADGAQLVSASADRSARVWNLSGEEVLACRGHFDTVNAAMFLPDPDEIVTGSDDYTARVWNVKSNRGTVFRKPHNELVWAAVFSPDGRSLVTVSEDGTIVRTDADTGQEISRAKEDLAVLSVVWSPHHDYFVTAGEDLKLALRDRKTCGIIKQVSTQHTDLIWDLGVSPDGKFIATASSDRTVKIWDTRDWSCVTTLTGHDGELASARFSPDGKLLVTSSDDKTLKLWDTADFKQLHTFHGHSNAIWRAVFSPSGDQIASSSYNGEIIIWDVHHRRQIRLIEAHTNQVAGLTFSPDGSRLVSGSDDRTIKLWDLESGVDLFVLRDKGDSPCVCVAFSSDGRRLASGNSSGWVTVRSAADAANQERPFLPEDANVAGIDGMHSVVEKDATEDLLRQELAQAVKACEHFPAFQTWTNRGIAEFRLNMIPESIASLEESARLEPIQYGEPDVKPFVEGYLAMAYYLSGDAAKAKAYRLLFEEKRKASLWVDDEETLEVAEQVAATLGQLSAH